MSSPKITDPVAVSAVMCTRNRHASIEHAVTTVLANDHPSFDMIVVDQSTDDSTGAILRPIAESDPRFTYLYTPEPGLSRAYNTGIKNTTGEVLVFTDDDCVVPTDWITRIVEAFQSEADGDLLYGQVVPYEGEGSEGDVLTPQLVIEHPTRMGKKDGFQVFGMGANFAARRRLFEKVGYFDEVLGGGGPLKSSQDFDLAYRVYKGDAITLLRPEVTLRHDGRREKEDWPTLLKNYGVGDGGFYTKHVRCRDPYAAWLLVKKLSTLSTKIAIKKVLGRTPEDGPYLRGIFTGIRASFAYDVDRHNRIYGGLRSKAAKGG